MTANGEAIPFVLAVEKPAHRGGVFLCPLLAESSLLEGETSYQRVTFMAKAGTLVTRKTEDIDN